MLSAKQGSSKCHFLKSFGMTRLEEMSPRSTVCKADELLLRHRPGALITAKIVFTPSLLSAQHRRDNVKNKLVRLLVVSLSKALNGMPPSLCGKLVVGPSSLPVVVGQSN